MERGSVPSYSWVWKVICFVASHMRAIESHALLVACLKFNRVPKSLLPFSMQSSFEAFMSGYYWVIAMQSTTRALLSKRRSITTSNTLVLSNLCDSDQLFSHILLHSLNQSIHIILGQAFSLDSFQDRHGNTPSIKNLPLDIQHIAIIRNNHRNDRNLSLHSKMESSLFEWQQCRCVGVRTCAFRKDEYGLLF
jgi:hypothetical protein